MCVHSEAKRLKGGRVREQRQRLPGFPLDTIMVVGKDADGSIALIMIAMAVVVALRWSIFWRKIYKFGDE